MYLGIEKTLKKKGFTYIDCLDFFKIDAIKKLSINNYLPIYFIFSVLTIIKNKFNWYTYVISNI